MLSKFLSKLFSPPSLVEQLERQKNYTLHNIDIDLYDINAVNEKGENALFVLLKNNNNKDLNYNKFKQILYKNDPKQSDKYNRSILFYAIKNNVILEEKEIDYLIANTDLNQIYTDNYKDNLYLHLRKENSFYEKLNDRQRDTIFNSCDLFYKNSENMSAAEYILCNDDINSKYFSIVAFKIFNKENSEENIRNMVKMVSLDSVGDYYHNEIYSIFLPDENNLKKMDNRLLAIWNITEDKYRLMRILKGLGFEEIPDFAIVREKHKVNNLVSSPSLNVNKESKSFKI